MADFLTRLAQRVLEPTRAVRPETVPVFPSSDQFDRIHTASEFEGERAVSTAGEVRVAAQLSSGEPSAEATLRSTVPSFEAPAARAASSLGAPELRASSISSVSNIRTYSGSVERAVVPALTIADVAIPDVTVPQVRQEFRGHGLQRPAVVPIQPRPPRDEMTLAPRQPTLADRPSVKITIGRIDVRAAAPNAQPSPARAAAARRPEPRSLENYLGERNGRRS